MNDTGSTPSAFGRVDADGTVYVRTSAGERAIGSWQAGTPEEGVAHYARRYDDLVTEVELVATRLDSGAADPHQSLTAAERLRESLAEAAVIGDLDAVDARLGVIVELAGRKAEEAKEARKKAREAAVARKEELIGEAENLATESTQWKVAGDRLREILDEWKTIKGIDRKTDSELWKRYAAARDAFNRRRGSHFAGLDAARKQVQGRKEELVSEAESLADSEDWQATAQHLKNLMTEWKELGRASREAEDRLWKRFRAAQDHFFGRRSAVLAERDEQFRHNQTLKEALLAEAETLDAEADAKQANARLRDIENRWDQIGRVPREAMAGLDRRLRAVEEKIRGAVDAQWRKQTASTNPLLEQMREQVARATQQLERARAAGDSRKVAQAQESLESKRRFLELAEKAN